MDGWNCELTKRFFCDEMMLEDLEFEAKSLIDNK